jgi:hypothetical protein
MVKCLTEKGANQQSNQLTLWSTELILTEQFTSIRSATIQYKSTLDRLQNADNILVSFDFFPTRRIDAHVRFDAIGAKDD